MVSIMLYVRGFQMKRYIGLSIIFVMATTVVVFARQNNKPSFGFVTVQEDVNAVLCNNNGKQFTIKGSKEPVQLPLGRYYINSWTLERTDKNGAIWSLQSKDITNKKAFDVADNARIKLPIGEPVVSTLTVKKGDTEFYFRHYLKGQLGEEIELTKNHSRPDPPKLLIRNKDGSYQESLTLKYG
jgi:hypothetical protein